VALFCISDLHLGDRGPRDNFIVGGREERLRRFLDFVDERGGRLLILGDLFDWWQSNLSRTMMAYHQLLGRMARMDGGEVRWIVGNHDNSLVEFIGSAVELRGLYLPIMSRPFESVIGGRKFAFLHGHEADPYCNSKNPGVGELTAIISGLLEDRANGPLNGHGKAIEDRFVGRLEKLVGAWSVLTLRGGRQKDIVANIEAYRVNREADIVVYGHTHVAGRVGRIFNCGTWARDRDTFVLIGDDGGVEVCEWTSSCEMRPYLAEL